jgi:hypothetical protein
MKTADTQPRAEPAPAEVSVAEVHAADRVLDETS